MAGIQQVSFTSPYSAEEQDIERRRRLADALQQQGQQGVGPTEMVGGWAIPKSPFEGLGKAAQQISGALQNKKLDEREKSLHEQAAQDRSRDLAEALRQAQGAPGQSYDDSMGIGRTQAAQAPDLAAALRTLAGSKDQMLSQTGTAGLLQRFVPKDPNAMIGKIDPKDYTPESFAAFVQSSDATKLRPRVKMESVNAGGTTQWADPYNPGGPIQHTVSPDSQAKLQWAQYEFNNLSADQRAKLQNEAQRLGVSVAELMFNTGQAPSGAGARLPTNGPMPPLGMAPTQNMRAPMNQPQPMQAPQMSPQGQQPPPVAPRPLAPQVAPSQPFPQPPVPGPMPQPSAGPKLSPKAAQELELERRKKMIDMNTKRDFNMGGLNDSLNAAEKILKGGQGDATLGSKETHAPTQSMIGAVGDWLGSAVGYTPNGAAEADQLKSIAGALVSKMPRMEGPQSDKDVQLYREMAGQLGDNTLPVARRIQALKTVRELYGKYEGQNQQNAPRVVDW